MGVPSHSADLRSRPFPTLLRSLRDGAIVSVALAVAYSALFHLSVVRGASMNPGIEDGDRILVEPWSYWLGDVDRGDVVVLQSPVDPSVDYIKRIVGLPGERVEVGPEGVRINGRILDEPYALPDHRTPHQALLLDSEHFFVMGDNRPQSADSRDFGQVHRSELRGRVDLRVWPLGRIGRVD